MPIAFTLVVCFTPDRHIIVGDSALQQSAISSTDAQCDQLEEEEWQHEANRLGFTLEEHENTCHLDEDEAHWVVTLNRLASVPDAEAGSSTGASSQT
jgi:hypothetical protein